MESLEGVLVLEEVGHMEVSQIRMTQILESQRGQGGAGKDMVVARVRHCAVGAHAGEV